jgi:hypothetical protein
MLVAVVVVVVMEARRGVVGVVRIELGETAQVHSMRA